GDFLDSRGIGGESAGYLAQSGVFRPLASDGGSQLIVLLARPKHRQQAPIANQAVNDDHGGNESDQKLDNASVSRSFFGGWRSYGRRSRLFLSHARDKVQQFRAKVH